MKLHKGEINYLTIHWHLVNLGRVILLDVPEDSDVVILDKVDGNTLAAKASRSTNTMDIQLTIVGQIIVDDQADLLNVNTTSPDVSGDEDTGLS